MSQRLYTGPTPGRGGSPLLLGVAWLLAAVTIGVQIYYPIAAQSDRPAVAVTAVCSFFLASLVHATARHGAAGFFLVGIVVPVVGLAVEAIALRSGWPFGDYTYSDVLGVTVLDVPVVVGLAWAMMAYPCYVAASTLSRRPWMIAVIGAWALMAWDLFLDPMMVDLQAWTWHDSAASIPGIDNIPAQNFVGWFVVGFVITAVLLLLPPPRASATQPATLFLWVFVSSIVANAIYFDRREVAIVGGLAMSLVALPYAWRLWDTRT